MWRHIKHNRQSQFYGSITAWMAGCGWMDGLMDGWMDGLVDGWMYGWMDVWMYEWMDE